jgi:WD40 repeat protein
VLRIESAYRVHDGQGGFVGFFPDGRTLWSTALERDGDDLDCALKVWRPDAGVVLHRREFDYDPAVALSGDGRYLAWNRLSAGVIRLVRRDQTGPDREVLVGEEARVNGLLFVPGTHDVLVAFDDYEAEGQWWRWDVTTDWPGRRLDPPVSRLLAVSPDGRRLALCPADPDTLVIEYWDLAEFRPLARFTPPETGGRKAAWHPARPLLATTGYGAQGLEVWDFTNPAPPRRSLHDPGDYNHQAFLPDGRLVTAHESGELAVWDVDAGRRVATASTAELGLLKLAEEPDQVTVTQDRPGLASVAVSPDGRTVAAMTYGGAVALFKVG